MIADEVGRLSGTEGSVREVGLLPAAGPGRGSSVQRRTEVVLDFLQVGNWGFIVGTAQKGKMFCSWSSRAWDYLKRVFL